MTKKEQEIWLAVYLLVWETTRIKADHRVVFPGERASNAARMAAKLAVRDFRDANKRARKPK